MNRRSYIVEFFKVGFGGSVRVHGRTWTAWPWCRWVRVWHWQDARDIQPEQPGPELFLPQVDPRLGI